MKTLLSHPEEVKAVLLEKPLSLMGEDKNAVLQRMVKKSKAKKILEIGTFAAGTAYRLAKENPQAQILSIDVNDFEGMFANNKNDMILDYIKRRYRLDGIEIFQTDLLQIQKIYEDACSNLRLETATIEKIDVSDFDFVLVDGDHSSQGCSLDLETIVKNNNKCNIIVDDCYFTHIHRLLEPFANKHNMKLKFVYKSIKKRQPKDMQLDGLAYLRRR